jgi:chromosome segregation ATPase
VQASEQLAAVTDKLRMCELQLTATQSALSEQVGARAGLQQQLDTAARQLADAEQRERATAARTDVAASAAAAEASTLRQQLQEAQTDAAALRRANSELTQQHEAAQRSLEECREQVMCERAAFGAADRELVALRRERNELEDALAAAERSLQASEGALKGVRGQLAEMRADAAESEHSSALQAAEADALRADLAAATQRLEATETEAAGLRAEVSALQQELQAGQDALEAAAVRITRLQLEAQGLESDEEGSDAEGDGEEEGDNGGVAALEGAQNGSGESAGPAHLQLATDESLPSTPARSQGRLGGAGKSPSRHPTGPAILRSPQHASAFAATAAVTIERLQSRVAQLESELAAASAAAAAASAGGEGASSAASRPRKLAGRRGVSFGPTGEPELDGPGPGDDDDDSHRSTSLVRGPRSAAPQRSYGNSDAVSHRRADSASERFRGQVDREQAAEERLQQQQQQLAAEREEREAHLSSQLRAMHAQLVDASLRLRESSVEALLTRAENTRLTALVLRYKSAAAAAASAARAAGDVEGIAAASSSASSSPSMASAAAGAAAAFDGSALDREAVAATAAAAAEAVDELLGAQAQKREVEQDIITLCRRVRGLQGLGQATQEALRQAHTAAEATLSALVARVRGVEEALVQCASLSAPALHRVTGVGDAAAAGGSAIDVSVSHAEGSGSAALLELHEQVESTVALLLAHLRHLQRLQVEEVAAGPEAAAALADAEDRSAIPSLSGAAAIPGSGARVAAVSPVPTSALAVDAGTGAATDVPASAAAMASNDAASPASAGKQPPSPPPATAPSLLEAVPLPPELEAAAVLQRDGALTLAKRALSHVSTVAACAQALASIALRHKAAQGEVDALLRAVAATACAADGEARRVNEVAASTAAPSVIGGASGGTQPTSPAAAMSPLLESLGREQRRLEAHAAATDRQALVQQLTARVAESQSLSQSCRELAGRVSAVSNRLDGAMAAKAAAERQAADLAQALGQSRALLQQAAARAAGTEAELRRKLQAAEAARAALEAAAAAQVRTLRADLAQASDERVGTATALRSARDDASSARDAHSTQVSALLSEFSAWRQALGCPDAEAAAALVTALRQQLAATQQAADEAGAQAAGEARGLQAQLQAALDARTDLEAMLRAQAAETQTQVAAVERQLRAVEGERDDLASQVVALQGQVGQLGGKVSELVDVAKGLLERKTQLKGEVKDLKTDLAVLRAQLRDARAEAEGLRETGGSGGGGGGSSLSGASAAMRSPSHAPHGSPHYAQPQHLGYAAGASHYTGGFAPSPQYSIASGGMLPRSPAAPLSPRRYAALHASATAASEGARIKAASGAAAAAAGGSAGAGAGAGEGSGGAFGSPGSVQSVSHYTPTVREAAHGLLPPGTRPSSYPASLAGQPPPQFADPYGREVQPLSSLASGQPQPGSAPSPEYAASAGASTGREEADAVTDAVNAVLSLSTAEILGTAAGCASGAAQPAAFEAGRIPATAREHASAAPGAAAPQPSERIRHRAGAIRSPSGSPQPRLPHLERPRGWGLPVSEAAGSRDATACGAAGGVASLEPSRESQARMEQDLWLQLQQLLVPTDHELPGRSGAGAAAGADFSARRDGGHSAPTSASASGASSPSRRSAAASPPGSPAQQAGLQKNAQDAADGVDTARGSRQRYDAYGLHDGRGAPAAHSSHYNTDNATQGAPSSGRGDSAAFGHEGFGAGEPFAVAGAFGVTGAHWDHDTGFSSEGGGRFGTAGSASARTAAHLLPPSNIPAPRGAAIRERMRAAKRAGLAR